MGRAGYDDAAVQTTPRSSASGTRVPHDHDRREPTGIEPATPPGAAGSGTLDPSVALGYVLAGPLFYGGVGWLLDRWLGITLLLPIGALLGTAAGIYLLMKRLAR